MRVLHICSGYLGSKVHSELYRRLYALGIRQVVYAYYQRGRTEVVSGNIAEYPITLKIGDNVMMGPRCWILDTDTHRHDRIDIPMIDQGRFNSGARTEIGDDVWIGRECLMIGGKKIGNHTIIGARSVVSKDIPDYVIAAGNPIRIIRKRE